MVNFGVQPCVSPEDEQSIVHCSNRRDHTSPFSESTLPQKRLTHGFTCRSTIIYNFFLFLKLRKLNKFEHPFKPYRYWLVPWPVPWLDQCPSGSSCTWAHSPRVLGRMLQAGIHTHPVRLPRSEVTIVSKPGRGIHFVYWAGGLVCEKQAQVLIVSFF